MKIFFCFVERYVPSFSCVHFCLSVQACGWIWFPNFFMKFSFLQPFSNTPSRLCLDFRHSFFYFQKRNIRNFSSNGTSNINKILSKHQNWQAKKVWLSNILEDQYWISTCNVNVIFWEKAGEKKNYETMEKWRNRKEGSKSINENNVSSMAYFETRKITLFSSFFPFIGSRRSFQASGICRVIKANFS